MSDVNTVLNQLSKVRLQLDDAQRSPDPKAHDMMDKKAISQLIFRLSLMCQGIDQELDTKLTALRHQVSETQKFKLQIDDLFQLETLLKHHQHSIKKTLDISRNLATSSGEQLARVNGLPPQLRRDLQSFMAQPQPYALQDNQNRLVQMLDFYHQALINKPFPGLAADPKLNRPKESLLDDRLHKRICDDLQRLISELDYKGEVGEKLADLRIQLLSGVAAETLPALCLDIIQLIIDGTREERKSSQEFLITLNRGLATVHAQFTDNVTASRELHNEQAENSGQLRSHLLELGAEVSNSRDLDKLKNSIQERLDTIGDVFRQKERLENQTKTLVERLSTMEGKLRLIREEASEYKKQLSTHKNKIFIDSLTQIYNRTAFDERLDLEYKRWQRYGYNLGIAIIDIDHFKSINDSFGHLAGDKALKIVAHTLKKSVRDSDFLARFGGEEFVILMPNISPDQLQVPLESLREQIAALPFRFKDKQVSITISIGATLFKETDKPLDAFERADQALYEAKSSGRDKTNIIS
jgi:diguanylate cyclase (GGDEF)-like protein